MGKFVELISQRRIWVALIPASVMVAQVFGVEITEDVLTNTFDKVLAGGMSALALWSYFAPKSS